MPVTGQVSRNKLISQGKTNGVWKQGLSAYQVAVENGFQGSEVEWLTSLKGEPCTIARIETDSEGNKVVTFSDNTVMVVPKGDKPIITYESGVIYCTYPDQLKEQLVDLENMVQEEVQEKFDANPSIKLVDQLPNPSQGIEGIIYILREEVD